MDGADGHLSGAVERSTGTRDSPRGGWPEGLAWIATAGAVEGQRAVPGRLLAHGAARLPKPCKPDVVVLHRMQVVSAGPRVCGRLRVKTLFPPTVGP